MSSEFDLFMPTSPNWALDNIEDVGSHLSHRHQNLPVFVEEKYDGSLYVARFEEGGKVSFKSRRTSAVTGEAVDKSENLPYHNWYSRDSLKKTLLVGEMIAKCGRGSFKDTVAIMGAGPDKAVARQQEDYISYIVFDCLWFGGRDLRNRTLSYRREYATEALKHWAPSVEVSNRVASTKTSVAFPRKPVCLSTGTLMNSNSASMNEKELRKIYEDILFRGGEGIMIKDYSRSSYGEGVTKVKKNLDTSVVCTGFEPAKEGKYKGMIGALKFSVHHNGQLIEVGQASGMTDQQRDFYTKSEPWKRRLVMDVRFQPFDDPNKWNPEKERFRHPRFLRFREDLADHQCTSKKVVSDMLRYSKKV